MKDQRKGNTLFVALGFFLIFSVIVEGNILDSLISKYEIVAVEEDRDLLGNLVNRIPFYQNMGPSVEKPEPTYHPNPLRAIIELNQNPVEESYERPEQTETSFDECKWTLSESKSLYTVSYSKVGVNIHTMPEDISTGLADLTHSAEVTGGAGVVFAHLDDGMNQCCCKNIYEHLDSAGVSPANINLFLEFTWEEFPEYYLNQVANEYLTPIICDCAVGQPSSPYDFVFNPVPIKPRDDTSLKLGIVASNSVFGQNEENILIETETQNTGFSHATGISCELQWDQTVFTFGTYDCETCVCDITDVSNGVMNCTFDDLSPGEERKVDSLFSVNLVTDGPDRRDFRWECEGDNILYSADSTVELEHEGLVVRYYEPCESMGEEACECDDFVVNRDDKEMLAIDENGTLYGCLEDGHLRNLCDVINWVQHYEGIFSAASKRMDILERTIEKQQNVINRLTRELGELRK